jgi:hypothetical protein
MTNELLSEQQGLINFAIKFHNAKVMEAYGHKKDEESQKIISLMLLTDKDSLVVSLYKMNNFYNVADRATREYIDYPGQSIVKRSPAGIIGEIRLVGTKKHVNGKPVGSYRVKIPHFKEELVASVRDYHQEFGNVRMLYVFADKKQLKAVDPAKKLGTAEEHAYKGNMPPDAEPHKLTGLTMTAKAIRVIYPDKTSVVHQI